MAVISMMNASQEMFTSARIFTTPQPDLIPTPEHNHFKLHTKKSTVR
jgi:hypothetical protein